MQSFLPAALELAVCKLVSVVESKKLHLLSLFAVLLLIALPWAFFTVSRGMEVESINIEWVERKNSRGLALDFKTRLNFSLPNTHTS